MKDVDSEDEVLIRTEEETKEKKKRWSREFLEIRKNVRKNTRRKRGENDNFFFFLSKRERGGSLDLGKGYTRFCLGGPGLSGWVM